MNKNIPNLSTNAKNEIEKHVFGLFSGLTWHFWMSGKTLGDAWIEAGSGRAKQYPNNQVVRHIREYSATHLAKFLEHTKSKETRNDKMNVLPEKYNEYSMLGTKWTNEGINGLNRQIKAHESKQPPLTPYQFALRIGGRNQRDAA